MRIRGARNSVFASSKLVLRTHAMYSGEKRITYFRGGLPLGLPYTLSREPLRRLAPFAWLASLRSLASFFSRLASPEHRSIRRRESRSRGSLRGARARLFSHALPRRSTGSSVGEKADRVARSAALARVFFLTPCLAGAPVHPSERRRIAWLASLRSRASFFSRLASPEPWRRRALGRQVISSNRVPRGLMA